MLQRRLQATSPVPDTAATQNIHSKATDRGERGLMDREEVEEEPPIDTRQRRVTLTKNG